jgi:hypothetical protein
VSDLLRHLDNLEPYGAFAIFLMFPTWLYLMWREHQVPKVRDEVLAMTHVLSLWYWWAWLMVVGHALMAAYYLSTGDHLELGLMCMVTGRYVSEAGRYKNLWKVHIAQSWMD